MAFCTKCGKQLPDNANFCGGCGAQVKRRSQASNSSAGGSKGTRNVPVYTPPGEMNTPGKNDIPVFTPPGGTNTSGRKDIPVFTPPGETNTPGRSDIPVFTPPGGNGNAGQNVPTFDPPNQPGTAKQAGQGIPTFTPPPAPRIKAPTFTPPRTGIHGAVCSYHSSEPAVSRCARCGKYICQDCAEAYGVNAGEYANRHLCYDCCRELVAQNVEDLTRNKKKIRNQFILQIIGMVIGFIYGLAGGIANGSFGAGLVTGLICAGIGGVFLSALKAFFSLTWEAIKIAFAGEFGIITIISLLVQSTIIVFKCIWITITNTFYYITYLKETSGFIEQDSNALEQMRDYMEYTLVRNKNRGVDLESLMQEGGELYDNAYAQDVARNGEEAADARLRQMTTRIAENGEIIREFRDAA